MKFIALLAILLVAIVVAVWVGIARRSRAHLTIEPDVAAAQHRFLLVVLRRAPADLRQSVIEAAARSAWLEHFGPNADGSSYVERGVSNVMYVLQAHGNAFSVIASKKGDRTLKPPSISLPDSAAALWHEYSHDVSVGVTYNYDTDPARLAAFVGRLSAALCDHEAIAIYHPASRRLWKLDSTTIERLTESPVTFFEPAAADASGFPKP